VHVQGSASIDLSAGGPTNQGSDLATFGGPPNKPGGVSVGAKGHYFAPAAPVSDPFALIPAPAQPTQAGVKTNNVPQNTNGCPDSKKCEEYSPGYYPAGIDVNGTAIFDPGIYYIVGGLSAHSNTCLRPSTAAGDGSGGTLFYFADANSLAISANSGMKCPSNFVSTSGTGSVPFGVKCTGASFLPGNVPAGLPGNVLLGPCTAPTVSSLCAPNCAINYGDPAGTGNPIGQQRGMLLFQNRSQSGATASFQGTGDFLFSGNVYIHHCGGAGTGGTGCSGSAFTDSLLFKGTPGSATIVGQIVTDQLQMRGNSGITMDLNSTTSYSTLKATLLR
jgi:hypothetical protein